VDEVASVTEWTVTIVHKNTALLGFVFGVQLTVFSQFVGSVGEFAFLFVRAESTLHEFFAQLAFLFVVLFTVM